MIDDVEPILEELLGMSAVLKKAIGKDDENEIVYQEFFLENIRIEFQRNITRDKDGNEVLVNALLFFDSTFSQPVDVIFDTDDIIEFSYYDGIYSFKIISIEPQIAFSNPVYWIIGLV